MYKTFTLPLKSAFALSALFILAACGGFTIDLNYDAETGSCIASPFQTKCDGQASINTYRTSIIENCAANPSNADTQICVEADAWVNPPSDGENGAEDEVVVEVVGNTPKKTEVKIEFDKSSLTKTDKEKSENTGLEIVDFCSDPANAKNTRCSLAVLDCINNPFSGRCEGDNVLGNFVRGGVTVSKTIILQEKRVEDCRDGNIDRAQCDTLNSEKARCAGTDVYDASCSAVVYSVCKADVFDPLCGEKAEFTSVYFNERTDTCYEDPNNQNCIGSNGHIAVACGEYPFDRLCLGNTNYDDARANACEANPSVSSSCTTAPVPEVVDVCLDNPFGPTCADSDYNNARRDLAKTCAVQAVTGLVTSACDTIIEEALPCFVNPFDSACDENPAVRSYIAELRSTRVEFCKNDTRLFDRWIAPLCTGAPVAKSVCAIDPFNTACVGDNTYTNDRLTACRNGTATALQCYRAVADICIGDSGNPGNPFNSLCYEYDFDSVYAEERQVFCLENVGDYRCGDIIANFCGNAPFDSPCFTDDTYADARENICRGNPNDERCGGTISSICLDNPFDPLCGGGYTLDRRALCTDDPFAPRCAGEGYNDLRDSFCEGKVGTHSSCPAPEPTIPQVTASVWADSFDEPLATSAGGGHNNSQFLIGREADLDTGGVRSWFSSGHGDRQDDRLTFADATFNGVALGGDREDGAAFFTAASYSVYAGILSGTNLGAPLTNTIGTAKWVGSFKVLRNAPADFVLNVSFGAGDGAGEIEAFVEKGTASHWSDYYVTGEFDDTGVITGKVRAGAYRRSDSHNREEISITGKLTGLIGEEGAVGAFIMGLTDFGGFVARPSSTDELQTVEQTCADDPFSELCNIGYESERNEVIEHCITGGNASDASCDSANEWYSGDSWSSNISLNSCINNPFRYNCDEYLPNHYERARANRVAFCRTVGNANNALCTVEDTFAHICTNHPFDAQCLGNNDYNEARENACDTAGTGSPECQTLAGITCSNDPFSSYCGGGYNDARESACASNPNSSRCSDTLVRVCNGNPFNRLCRNTQTYLNTRVSICRGNPLDGRCGWTISTICNSNPFDTVCGNPGWNNAREIACRAGTATTGQCRTTVAGICSDNPFDTLCGGSYTQSRRSLCTDDPFAQRCAGEGYNDLRVDFCQDNAGTHPECPAPTPQVTAGVWADSFDEDLAHGATADDRKSQFLIARETDLDTGGRRPLYNYSPNYSGNLNLADATFNGVALGGDRADGAAFFAAERARNGRYYSYAGILEDTNLGAPLTDTQGSAKWIGSFQVEGSSPTDFVLNISFGTGAGAGEIEALVQSYRYSRSDYHIAGEFDDTGVITGTARQGFYRTNDADNRGSTSRSGKLTGLIGEEGAVGAFLISNSFGGFVARPTSANELRTLEQTCASDPFNKSCTIGYESQRDAVIEHCITGGNANDARCDSAKELHPCINNPFKSNCYAHLSQHYHQQARINRVAFCRTAGNAGNRLCTVEKTFAHICTNHPFDAQCRGDNSYRSIRMDACSDNPFATRCAGDAYNGLRVSFCEDNAGNSACPQTPQVTAEVWADSFESPLSHVPTANSTKSKFLIGRATDLNDGGLDPYSTNLDYNNGLNLADATFNRVALGGDAADGVGFFAAGRNGTSGVYSYAGVLSGTNLGAPLTDTIGSAKWVGSFRVEGRSPQDFVLNVSFGAGAGEIETVVEKYNEGDYHITGEFDDTGVITGTARIGDYNTNNPTNRGRAAATGELTGLIGEEGAVGAFLIGSWFGGFVARPSSEAELRTLEQTCADDPFNKLCAIGYESERNVIIEHCITGDNALNEARCGSANKWSACIKTPFNRSRYCDTRLSTYYEQIRANRVEFCRTAGNAGNALCTVNTTFNHICRNHPFDAQCLGDDRYTLFRTRTCTNDPFATECAGDAYNGLRVSFCEGKVGTHPSCPAPEPTTPQVTAGVWADSFDEDLAHGATAEDTESKLLIGRETDLDTGGLRPYNTPTNLNLADATFNGVALGGDRADGVAFFAAARTNNYWRYSYAGIMSGTNLGAPLTDTEGSAKWIGSFRHEHNPALIDFVLNVSFGTGDGAGEIEALVERYVRYYDYHLTGEFDDAGVITGTARRGEFRTNDPTNRGTTVGTGKLTGLIGEEGAVGAFIIDNYFGGFVARPSSAAELRTLEQTCADDPFHKLCSLGYESERNAIIERCIIGGNANDESCRSVKGLPYCVNDPFYASCNVHLSSHYEQARANRVAYCRTAGNEGNALCTVEKTFAYICMSYPFDAQCRGDNDYRTIRRNACSIDPFATRCAGDVYNDVRVTFCETHTGNPSCPSEPVVSTTTSDRVTTADWLASFNTPLSDSSIYVGNHFVTTIATGLDETSLRNIFGSDPYVNTLNLADATFKGRAFGGDATDGVVIFRGKDRRSTIGPEYGNITHYAGILPGTDLGAPVNEPDGQVIWQGQFLASGHEYANRDFSLHIHFGDGDGAGTLRATVQEARGDQYYRINGRFDDNGVITGTSKFGRGYYGILTGLIGEEGAVGVFVSNQLHYGGYVGGFVASPTLPDLSLADTTPNRVTTADWVASFETAPVDVADVNNNHFLQTRGKNSDFRMPYPTIYRRLFSNISQYYLKLNDNVFQDEGGDRADGVVFYRAHNGDPSDSYFYAGVIRTTILGAPLSETSGTATWSGRFGAIFADSNRAAFSNDFTLGITFNGTGGDISTVVNVKGRDYFELGGTFNKQGVISGTVNHVYYENGRIGNVTTGDIVNSGPVTGLIGEEGAVGAFFSNRQTGNTSGFAGGFVARPPSQ